jgi:hypothetical protein
MNDLLNKILFLLFFAFPCFAADIHVSTKGNDRNDGSRNNPQATLHAALRQARELRRLEKIAENEPVNIILHGGTYPLYEPVFIRPEDSGTETSPTIIKSFNNENVILSGGVKVKDWKKEGKYRMSEAPQFNGNKLIFRNFWINGKKTARAKNVSDFEQMDRIINNDKKNEVLWVPASSVKKITKSNTAEMVLHQMWAISNLRIKSIDIQGDSAGIRFHSPESRIQFERPWPQPMMKEGFHSPFYLTNAIEFLDEPGEWFHHTKTNKIYYLPRKDEDLKTAETIIPALETLVEITGTIDRPVKNIRFENIGFQYTTWIRPSTHGHVPLQAGMYLIDAYKLRPPGVPGNRNKGIENQAWIGRPPAAVTLNNAQNIDFDGCMFEHLGSCGLDFTAGVKNSSVTGCLFKDIAGNGLQIGRLSDVALETHLPYDPTDEREICSNILISNNYITDIGNEDWGCVGICAGYVQDVDIEHNEICEVPYTGISLGWGWTKTVNCMRNNRIHANYIHHYAKFMYDVAGIYTLSVQPQTHITENVIDSIYKPSFVHDPNHWFYLYTDEGSSYITVKNNWCPSEKFLQNANGPGNTWENNGPMVSDSIKQNAGLQIRHQKFYL